jgi:hypothetical protein
MKQLENGCTDFGEEKTRKTVEAQLPDSDGSCLQLSQYFWAGEEFSGTGKRTYSVYVRWEGQGRRHRQRNVVGCHRRLVVVMGLDCRLSTAALGLPG